MRAHSYQDIANESAAAAPYLAVKRFAEHYNLERGRLLQSDGAEQVDGAVHEIELLRKRDHTTRREHVPKPTELGNFL